MKNLNKILAVAALSLISSASAQDYKILNSPRGAELAKHVSWVKGTPATPVVAVGYGKYTDYYIVTSPKDYQRIDDERAQLRTQENAPQQPEVAKLGYRATGDDGITASPKFRQFLDEHRTQFQVAPLK